MVPITSAGSRSGVNWIRENAMRRHSATVRTASVLASPGTPSSRTCPPVSKPMSRRSTIRSCATTRFATSRAIVWLSTASPVFAARVVILAPPPPLSAPPAPCPCCRVPTAPALRAASGGPEQRCSPEECRRMPQQRNQQRHRLRAPRQTHELGRRRHHLGIRVHQFALQWLEGPVRRLAHRSPVRGPQVHGRRDERVQDGPHGQRRQRGHGRHDRLALLGGHARLSEPVHQALDQATLGERDRRLDRKSTRLNSSHGYISYARFCLKKKKQEGA